MKSAKPDRSIYLIAVSPLLLWLIGSTAFRVEPRLIKFDYAPEDAVPSSNSGVILRLSQLNLVPDEMVVNGYLRNYSDEQLIFATDSLSLSSQLILELDGNRIMMRSETSKTLTELAREDLNVLESGQIQQFSIRIPASLADDQLTLDGPDGEIIIPFDQPFRLAVRVPATQKDQLSENTRLQLGMQIDRSDQYKFFNGVDMSQWLQVKGVKTSPLD